jgi:hypothetical protein
MISSKILREVSSIHAAFELHGGDVGTYTWSGHGGTGPVGCQRAALGVQQHGHRGEGVAQADIEWLTATLSLPW